MQIEVCAFPNITDNSVTSKLHERIILYIMNTINVSKKIHFIISSKLSFFDMRFKKKKKN